MLKIVALWSLLCLSIPLLQAQAVEKKMAAYEQLNDSSFQAQFLLHEQIEAEHWLDSAYFSALEQALLDAQRPFAPLFLPFCEQLMGQKEQYLAFENTAAFQNWLEMAEFASVRTGRDFEIAADMLFSLLAERLQAGIDQEQIDPEEPPFQEVILALKERQYGVSIPISDVDKGLHHLGQGNWSYLFNRVSTDYPIPFYGGLFLLGFALLFVLNRLRKKIISSKK